ncbi:hypothetical protein AL1_22500 [Alistipes shahii WAL 8301]|uniref:Uncharacterized protein n=1 Tax=Alistipes shahii WAL 8301 TaxID=717959 RepID=D4INK6_9BACT|nr:hypothetical protein AL1_22500 [Alistipes shahii WAL 8301]
MPAQETVRASFFCAGTAARGGSCLRGGLFMGWSVCGTVCGIVYGADSLRLRNLFKDEVRAGTGEPDRETGNRGIGESGAEVRSVSGQWSDRSAAGLQAGCFRGGANGLFCVRRNIYGGFLAPCAITRYIYKSELKKQTDR